MKPKNPYIQIGANLRALRRQRNIGQSEAGAKVDLSRTSVVNIENGTQALSLDNLYAFCIAYDCTPNDILISIEEFKTLKVRDDLTERILKEYPDKAEQILKLLYV